MSNNINWRSVINRSAMVRKLEDAARLTNKYFKHSTTQIEELIFNRSNNAESYCLNISRCIAEIVKGNVNLTKIQLPALTELTNCDVKNIEMEVSKTWTLTSPLIGVLHQSETFSVLGRFSFALKLIPLSSNECDVFIVNTGKNDSNISKLKISDNQGHRVKLEKLSPDSVCLQSSSIQKIGKVSGVLNPTLTVTVTFKLQCKDFRVPMEDVHSSTAKSATAQQLGVIRDLGNELEKSELADWTLVCEGKKYHCNSTILGLRSSVFRTMFAQEGFVERKNRETKIEDMECSTLAAMLKYIYTGQIEETQNENKETGSNTVQAIDLNLSDLLLAADKYNLQGLVDEVAKKLCANMTVENSADNFRLAFLTGEERLKDEASQMISDNYFEVKKTEGWSRLTQDMNVAKALEELNAKMAEHIQELKSQMPDARPRKRKAYDFEV